MSEQEKRVIVSLVSSGVVFIAFSIHMFGLYDEGLLEGEQAYSLIGQIFFYLIGGAIVVTIVVQILFTILHAIITKGYEPMMNDERDKLFSLKSMQIAFLIFSLGFVASMGVLALELIAPSIVLLLIILSMFVANFIGDIVKLCLYRGGL